MSEENDGQKAGNEEGQQQPEFTPINSQEEFERALGELVEWQIAEGVHFLVPCGSTGEAATMPPEEQARVVRLVAERAAGRVPVMAGAGSGRILRRHILPNIAGPLMVVATSEFGLMILFEAGLSFLGLGIQPPAPSWGSIMSAGRQYVERAWWLTVFPGLGLFTLVVCVNLLGDALRDRLDPRSAGR